MDNKAARRPEKVPLSDGLKMSVGIRIPTKEVN